MPVPGSIPGHSRCVRVYWEGVSLVTVSTTTRVRTYKNKHGVLFRFVMNHGVLRVLVAHGGEFARWDDHLGVGMIKHDAGVVRISGRDEWDLAVKVTAMTVRG